MTARVLVIGDIVTDTVAVIDGPVLHASDTAAKITTAGGGGGANTSAWLVAAGISTTLCGVVGTDEAGAARISELEALGVTCAVRQAPEASTGSVVVIAERTERTMLTDRGANLRLRPGDVERALNGAASPVHLHLSGYPLLDAASHPAAVHALARAAALGLTTSVDAASAGPLRRAPGFLEWVRGVDVLFANADEAVTLAGVSDEPDRLALALARHVGIAVVKLGAAGALAATGDYLVTVPAVPADVVDATGAGDAFAAGFLASWLAERDLKAALASGATLGARAVGNVGARPAVV